MCQANQTAGETFAGPSCDNKQTHIKATGPMVVELVQYDDEFRFGCDEVVTFDVSSWLPDRFRLFWEFMHTT
jgi:hypothetical protein